MYTIETDFNQTYIVAIDTYDGFPDVEVLVNDEGIVYFRQVKEMVIDKTRCQVVDVVALSPLQFKMLKEAINQPDGIYPVGSNKTALNKILERKKDGDKKSEGNPLRGDPEQKEAD